MRKFLVFGALFSIFFNLSCQKLYRNTPLIGVKIYAYDGDLTELYAEWERIGINTLFSSPELASNQEFMRLAKLHAKRVFLIVPTFYNAAALEQDSSLYAITRHGEKAIDDWVRFICPNNEQYRTSHLDYLRNIMNSIQPDGVSLDFIRYFVYWESVFPDQIYDYLPQTCFDDNCINAFSAQYNIQLPDSCQTIEKKADYILAHRKEEWVEFKCETISDYVAEMVKALKSIDPEVKINIHTVPWRSSDFEGGIRSVAGQDLKKIAPLVDYISPMCYHHMVIQSPEWIHEVVLDIDNQVPGEHILPSIQVNKAYLESALSETEFQNALVESLRSPSKGVIFWSWEALESSPGKVKIVRDYLNEVY